jgi:hypothetical protein
MALGQYRPGYLPAAEVEAVDGHRHLRIDAWAKPASSERKHRQRSELSSVALLLGSHAAILV